MRGERDLDRVQVDADHAAAPGGPFTLSSGVACLDDDHRRPADLFRAADAAQYAAKRVGGGGHLVGIDRHPIDVVLPNLRVVTGDVFTATRAELLGELDAFDAVLSDMAPDTTGIRHVDQARSEALFERALDIACETLAHGGNFIGKLFQGPDFQKLVARCRAEFASVKIEKPKGSRQASIEQYVVARGFHSP